jgi:hypothetical protein
MDEEDALDMEADELIDALIEAGALESTGIDKHGDIVYRITEKCKDLFPDLYYEHMKQTDDLSFSLWQKEVLEIKFSEDGTVYVSMTPENYLKYLEIEDDLSEEEQNL